MPYERSGGCTLGYTYSVGFERVKNTPLQFCVESLLHLLYVDL